MKQLLVPNGFDTLHLVAALLVLLCVWLAISLHRRATVHRTRVEKRLECVLEMLRTLNDDHPSEAQLLPLLRAISQIMQAEYYACYLLEASGQALRLRALYQQHDGGGSIEIGYSRLTSYDQNHYLPPLTLNSEVVPDGITLRPDREHPELLIPIGQGSGLVTIGPAKRCSPKQTQELSSWQETVGPVIAMIAARINSPKLTKQQASAQAKAKLRNPAPLQRLLLLLEQLTHSDGSALIVEQNGKVRLLAATDQEAEQDLQDSSAISDLFALLDGRDRLRFEPGTVLYSQVPPVVVMLGDHLLLLRAPIPQYRVAVLLWSLQPMIPEEHQDLLQGVLLHGIASLISAEGEAADRVPPVPISRLRALIEATERLLPQTGRHSELVARYALAIAKELQLPEASCRNVALAALLHDVGMATLPTGVLSKPGLYSEEEHALVAIHPDFGADLLLSVIGDVQVANIVRQHHERWDGQGYPLRVAGEGILLEGRILAAADLFVAKLSGRSYRRPLYFGQAIAAVQSDAGKQLDPRVVQGLLDWYAKKAAVLADPFQPLAPCWVMLCCPDGIRQSCPAYAHREINCWRIHAADCNAHDGDCASCMVYTEYIYRSRQER